MVEHVKYLTWFASIRSLRFRAAEDGARTSRIEAGSEHEFFGTSAAATTSSAPADEGAPSADGQLSAVSGPTPPALSKASPCSDTTCSPPPLPEAFVSSVQAVETEDRRLRSIAFARGPPTATSEDGEAGERGSWMTAELPIEPLRVTSPPRLPGERDEISETGWLLFNLAKGAWGLATNGSSPLSFGPSFSNRGTSFWTRRETRMHCIWLASDPSASLWTSADRSRHPPTVRTMPAVGDSVKGGGASTELSGSASVGSTDAAEGVMVGHGDGGPLLPLMSNDAAPTGCCSASVAADITPVELHRLEELLRMSTRPLSPLSAEQRLSMLRTRLSDGFRLLGLKGRLREAVPSLSRSGISMVNDATAL